MAPYVARVVQRYLVGPTPEGDRPVQLQIPVDSAPRALELGPTPTPVEAPVAESVVVPVPAPPAP